MPLKVAEGLPYQSPEECVVGSLGVTQFREGVLTSESNLSWLVLRLRGNVLLENGHDYARERHLTHFEKSC